MPISIPQLNPEQTKFLIDKYLDEYCRRVQDDITLLTDYRRVIHGSFWFYYGKLDSLLSFSSEFALIHAAKERLSHLDESYSQEPLPHVIDDEFPGIAGGNDPGNCSDCYGTGLDFHMEPRP